MNRVETLGSSLRRAARFVPSTKGQEFHRWVRLELGGYYGSNSAMNEDVVVPAYRTIVGQHSDLFGRPLILPPDLSFVSETRLRNPVEELEALASSKDRICIHDPDRCQLIRQYLNVDVHFFSFSPINVLGILAAIRTELEDRLRQIHETVPVQIASNHSVEEILELRPNIWGIGVNLRALWRNWKVTKKAGSSNDA